MADHSHGHPRGDHPRPRHAARLDPSAPLVADTRELGRRPGSMRPLQSSVPAPADLSIDVVGVPEGSPLRLDLRLESVMEGVYVSGSVVATLAGECGRCLDPVEDELEVEIGELFAYEHSTTSETVDDEDEVSLMVGDLLDLEPVVRDAIVTELPLTPLCRPDCAGLCPGCGEKLDVGQPPHEHGQVDPRWAGLQPYADDVAPE